MRFLGSASIILLQVALFFQTLPRLSGDEGVAESSAGSAAETSAEAERLGLASSLNQGPAQALSILAVGDVIPHLTVLNAAKDPATGSYDFRPSFRHVKPYIQAADLAICNVETVFTADGVYTGYPDFDSPEELAFALKDAGFDVGITANNHLLDQGIRGFEGSIDALRRQGLVTAGTRKAGEPRYVMLRVKGLDLAIIAYTFAGYDREGRLVINNFRVPPELEPRINYFTPRELAAGLAQIRSVIAAARAAGANAVICYYHWGEEYALVPDRVQQAIARVSVDGGADIVFGTHPHVVQKAQMLAAPGGRQVPVYYSLGNFISNQRLDTVDNRLTEDGLIALVNYGLANERGPFRLLSAQALATWVDKRQDERIAFEIIPIEPGFRANPTVQARKLVPQVEESLSAAKQALGASFFQEASMRFVFHAEGGLTP